MTLTLLGIATMTLCGMRTPHAPHTSMRAQIRMAEQAGGASSFFVVVHKFRDLVPQGQWWREFFGECNHESMAKRQHAKGLYCHSFLPSVYGTVFAIYETEDRKTPTELEEALDATDGPLGDWGALASTVVSAGDKGPVVLPPSAWPTRPKTEDTPSSGSFFWTVSSPRAGCSDTTLWRKHEGPPGGLAAPHPGKLFNHYFMQTQAGEPIYCVFETRDPMGADDFTTFLEGPYSPLPYHSYSHTVHRVMSPVPGAASLPSSRGAAFPQHGTGFLGQAWMPLMDRTMSNMAGWRQALTAFDEDAKAEDTAVDANKAAPLEPYGSWSKATDTSKDDALASTREEYYDEEYDEEYEPYGSWTKDDASTSLTEPDLDEMAMNNIMSNLPLEVKRLYATFQRDRARRGAGTGVRADDENENGSPFEA
jgi:hypothetical protein